jgi:putative CocE/NonD family hydrolase
MNRFFNGRGLLSSKGRNVSFYILASAFLILITMFTLIFNYLRSRTVTEEVMVPMRDGLKLHTKIRRPARCGSYPVVLTRGYWPGYRDDYKKFTKADYVYVGQSTRGHGQSEGSGGVANRFFDDADDGYDTLTWISKQPWCNGKIAMYGKSYWGLTQWLVALKQHPNLKAIIPQNVGIDGFHYGYRCNGALTLAMTARGRAYDRDDWNTIDQMGWMNYFRHLPLITLDEVVGGANDFGASDLWEDYVTHSTYDDYWKTIGVRADGGDGKYNKITIPVYLMGGWYDYYPGEALNSFKKLREAGTADEIRVIINPSDHLNRVVGDMIFEDNAGKDEIAVAIRWLDYVIKEIENGIKDELPVKIFVMGINEWRFENEWPLARTQLTNYYFRSNNGARIGWLSTEPPGNEVPTRYTYDPDNPVPTLGGNHSFSDNNIADIIRAGAVDQRPNEGRDDVLVFTSAPAQKDVEVTGPIVIKLYAASSVQDTDFTAKLIDVYPDGTAYNLTEGIIRARFRKSIYDSPKLLIPGKIYEYTLKLLPTSNVFVQGHSIRVHLTSSSFPLWDRNLNTGNDPATDIMMQKAEQTIYHDHQHPSHIILPIIPSV